MRFFQFFMFEISFQLWAMGSESFIHPHHQGAILKYEQYFLQCAQSHFIGKMQRNVFQSQSS